MQIYGTSIQWKTTQQQKGMNYCIDKHKNIAESQKHQAGQKKPTIKHYTMCDSIYMKLEKGAIEAAVVESR